MRKPLTLRVLSALDRKSWLALGGFLALALIVVPFLHLNFPEGSALHVSTYAITLIGKIMCYALVAVAIGARARSWRALAAPIVVAMLLAVNLLRLIGN